MENPVIKIKGLHELYACPVKISVEAQLLFAYLVGVYQKMIAPPQEPSMAYMNALGIMGSCISRLAKVK